MSVMQRKLFANKEARTKLRDMGGIMSSFPELSGEVQRFQDGGGVAPEFTPPVPSAYDQLVADSLFERTSSEPNPRRGGTPRATSFDLNLSETTAQPNPSRRGQEETPAPVPAPVVTEDDAEQQAAPTTEQRIVELIPTPEETPEVTTDETGNGDTPDLRARAEERIKLFQDLFGSDEPTARDRAMQFAMIGLAIAAGQSPNALTNIASGLLAGTQAMTAQEAERRKGARELKSDAVTSVLDELAEERKLTREQREKLLEKQDEIAKGWQEQYNIAMDAAEPVGLTGYEARNLFATNSANEWARTRYPDLFPEGGQEPLFTAPPLSPEQRQRTGQEIIERLRKENRSDAEIARLMREMDVDPAEFGITDG